MIHIDPVACLHIPCRFMNAIFYLTFIPFSGSEFHFFTTVWMCGVFVFFCTSVFVFVLCLLMLVTHLKEEIFVYVFKIINNLVCLYILFFLCSQSSGYPTFYSFFLWELVQWWNNFCSSPLEFVYFVCFFFLEGSTLGVHITVCMSCILWWIPPQSSIWKFFPLVPTYCWPWL